MDSSTEKSCTVALMTEFQKRRVNRGRAVLMGKYFRSNHPHHRPERDRERGDEALMANNTRKPIWPQRPAPLGVAYALAPNRFHQIGCQILICGEHPPLILISVIKPAGTSAGFEQGIGLFVNW